MARGLMFVCMAVMGLAGCQTVRIDDTQAWVGRPVSDLDLHPVFLTMRMVRTEVSDGTQIRNYINSANISSCSSDASIFGSSVSSAMYTEFSSCMGRVGACNNIFYIKGGRVESYVPTGSGGMRCYTDERTRPGFRGASNFS